ncbi:uncharacterized protein LY89DRAFT_732016 [Mollisia scopiformis]|uniref:Uncharacterized protein n=1 Tax=Mollisia scopiformis TaxID=149040 RepID=A0A194XE87_MOLSC|nr:uncharacterized protein LY89DRAFT_732016 [Mollisia scopiformis]KUJ18459.1 hypothetical protein LY89DRAFT_732016 [Mollisia scopiformis]
MKHLDEPGPFGGSRQPAYNQGYQAPEPMMGGALPVAGKPGPPQYAQFEVGKNGFAVDPTPTPLSEDALPPMPSWDSAAKKHVLTEDEKNGVELGELDPTTGQHVPLMTGAAATGISTPSPIDGRGHSPFGARPGPGAGGTGYMGVDEEHYDQNQTAYNGNGRGYGSPMAGPGMGPQGVGMGMGPPRTGTPQMRGSPALGQGPRRPPGPGGYGPNPSQSYNGQARGYGPSSPQDSYGQNDSFADASVGGGRGYGRAQPQRQFSNDHYGDEQYSSRPFPAQPSRQYSSDSQQPLALARQYSDGPGYPQDNFQPSGPPPRGPSRGPGGPNRMASPPLQNNSGFDFGGGQQDYQTRPSPPPQQYGRPSPPLEQMSYGSSNRPSPPTQSGRGNDGYFAGSTAAPSYATRTPPPQEPTYPGYKPYQPTSTGRGREPQGWDPVQQ